MALITVPPAVVSDNYTLLNAGGTSLTGSTVNITGISGKQSLLIYITNSSASTTYRQTQVRFNGDSGGSYYTWGTTVSGGSNNQLGRRGEEGTTAVNLATQGDSAAGTVSGVVCIFGANTSGYKPYTAGATYNGNSGEGGSFSGFYTGTSPITSVNIISSGTFDSGTVWVYGA